MKSILNTQDIAITIKRLAQQIIENQANGADIILIGLQPRGIYLSDRIHKEVKQLIDDPCVKYGKLDITFYRDDVRNTLHKANETDIPFSIQDKTVILIDDVLYTGRTIRAALDALLDFGRPGRVELCVLIDRRFSREFPIQADYSGRAIDSFENQKVLVRWTENSNKDEVYIV
ncbi:MAG TPA: bifunctional pyr operon transcriptional regulator/uracil phosphoribosyltransferase PyrR [Niabella sp.]|nr:bifunctional pyr operon transcriptional regulator/uracil phosphoribosyltransferase PyrR [Niabella sp.]